VRNRCAMKINERLHLLRMELDLTQPEAAAKFHIPLPSWKNYEKGPSEPGSGALTGMVEAGVNINWVLTGEGDMLLHGGFSRQDTEEKTMTRQETLEMINRLKEESGGVLNRDKVQRPQRSGLDIFDVEERKPAYLGHSQQACNDRMGMSAANLGDFALVPFYDVEASAGNGSLVDQELQKSEMAFRKDWLSQRGLQISKCVLIKARGDSMEPTIFHGDILLVDTSIESIKDDAIYIVQSDHHLIVKRIQQSLDGSLTIISDNERYKEQTISPDQAKEIKIAGRVRWYGHEI